MIRLFSKYSKPIQKCLSSPRLPFALACLGMLLSLPSLGAGLCFDDYTHRMILRGEWRWPFRDFSPIGMFSFMNGDPARCREMMSAGFFPWFTYTGIRACFWRPVTEFTHWLDYRLWPEPPWLMHAQSILWYAAIVWTAAIFYRRIMGFTWAAGLAGLMYAIDASHGLPIGFLANRNAMVCAFFGLLTMVLHDRWRRSGWRAGAAWGPVCFAAALLSGEMSTAAGGYLFAYALFIERGDIRKRALGFAPYAAIALCWAIFHSLNHFGTYGMGGYVDPRTETGPYMAALVERAPILLLGLFAEPPSDLYGIGFYKMFPHGNQIAWLAAAAFLAFLGFMLWPLLRRSAAARFFALGTLLSMPPICATFPHGRLLFFAGAGGMGLIAAFMELWLDPAHAPGGESNAAGEYRSPIMKFLAGGLGVLFIVSHLILSPPMLTVNCISFAYFHEALMVKPTLTMPLGPDAAQKTVILVNPPSAFWGGMYMMLRGAKGLPSPARLHVLASGAHPLKITRSVPNSLEVECKKGFLRMTFEQLLRAPTQPMRVGERVELSGFSAEVLEIADGWQPSCARFTFERPLDDPSYLFLQWKDRRFVPFTPPPEGKSEILPPARLF